ncbi:MAG: KdsC family phosphatase [Magnetospiraceae bacterium]
MTAPKDIDPDLFARLRQIKLLSLDVDGVLTDSGLYYTDSGEEIRRFNVKDGMGIKLARRAGCEVCILSAGTGDSILHRGRQLGLDLVFHQVRDKKAKLAEICSSLGIGLADTAHMGDDTNDMPLMAEVGFALAPADAMPAVRDAADLVTVKGGGMGCVREVCDLIVQARDADPVFTDGVGG